MQICNNIDQKFEASGRFPTRDMAVALQIPPHRRTWRRKSACKLQRVMAFNSATEHPSSQQIAGTLYPYMPGA
ncbi:hypothetical protein SUGI_0826160 [Cryptomeria japonica]|nr:hypothetical protein SUGI_0826160 [Cryptomeria japonica]